MATDLRLQFEALQEQKRQKLLKRHDPQRKNGDKSVVSKEDVKPNKSESKLSTFGEIDDDLNLTVSLYHPIILTILGAI